MTLLLNLFNTLLTNIVETDLFLYFMGFFVVLWACLLFKNL